MIQVMDPVLDWFAKNEALEETPIPGNVARSWQWRERGINPPNSPCNKTVLENVAEDILVQKPLKIRCCDLPGYPRSTFLMVFSPDGTKVASTHGNHNVYVSELSSGKHVRILEGHPRTPWCIAFHPSHPQLIGSGCLGGQVRVWDISSGGSEVWNVSKETVIASIAFHPREQLLVIATYNELYFWDWSQPAPFTKVSTNNINEKVRYVAFDSLGYKLITGISLRNMPGGIGNSVLQPNPPTNNTSIARRDDADDNTGNNRPQDNSGSTQDIIVNSYQNLVQRYDSLVRNYQRLFMVRQRLTVTPPPPSTTDRGTDPMETDPSPEANSFTRVARSYTATPQLDDDNSTTDTSSNRPETDNGDGEGGSSRLLNLDALSFDSGLPRDRNPARQEHSIFGSRPSAFHPLNDTFGRSFRTVDQNERASRLLPNPFSSTNGTPRPNRVSFTSLVAQPSTDNVANSSRTSLIPAYLSSRTWGDSRRIFLSVRNTNSSAPSDNPSPTRASRQNAPTSASNATQTNTCSSQSQSDGLASVDAQTINESLDLIRDILRDSGARLLNLITNMSLRISPEDDIISARRGSGTNDDNESGERAGTPPRIRLIRSTLLPSSSESDSDPSPEVNIFRTRNSTFREDDVRESERPERSSDAEASNSIEREPPTDRLDFELGELQLQNPTHEMGGISISAHSSRFRVRTQNNDAGEGPSTSSNVANQEVPENSNQNDTSEVNSDRQSSNTENILGTAQISPEEAIRRVRSGVIAIQKHTLLLANMWLRGDRTTMPELRNMWENLRRRIIALHRETSGQDAPSHYRASLLERCMMLNQVANNNTRTPTRNSRPQSSHQGESSRNSEATNTENAPSDEPEHGASREDPSTSRQSPASRSSAARSTSIQWSSPLRRRTQSSYRWRPDEELRRKSRNPASARLPQRSANRPRRDFGRTMEISATRHEIRMRAMQVLSVMFNMMMICLEERGLSQLIITMLRSLKRALALTCLMLINRNNGRAGSNTTSPQRVESLNVIRLENVDHLDPVNVDGPDEPSQNTPPSEVEEDRLQSSASKRVKRDNSTSSHSVSTENNARETSGPVPSTSRHNNTTQKWSNRLAVQISAANRNYSATARNRRELYMESRRLKALHRTNPAAHPLIKRRVLPPVSSHRIPALRSFPSRVNIRSPRAATTATTERQSEDPVPGPSGLSSDNSNRPPRVAPDMISEFEHRINLIRLAHVQAVRLRNAARSRFRRLQTIRLYTPSSVREMFNLPPTTDSPPENGSPLQDRTPPLSDSSNRRSFSSFDYRPHFLTRERILSRGATNRPTEESRMEQYQAAIEDAAAATIPLLQVGDLSINNPDVQANPPPRLQRNQQIHEYLQPIILAQNAMVIDDEGSGEGGGGGGAAGGGGGAPGAGGLGGVRRMSGMAGLLDASIISEALPAPSHRVQAWDFTTGNAPDIADSTKNVVVQRCRIHNDASIDISKDGRLLVALHPVPRLRNTNHWLGVYSLEWSRLGQCLHTAVLEQSAVSVALSPTARHLAVGLGSRRFTLAPHGRSSVFALLYRLDPLESTSRTGLSPIKELEQTWENGFTSLNCLRWAPQPGQGLVYANNTGQLIIMS